MAPALAGRVIDITDEETKEFCSANPEKCETRWAWEYTIGAIAFLFILKFGLKFATGLSRHRIPGPGEEKYVKPSDRVKVSHLIPGKKHVQPWSKSDAIAFYLAIQSKLPKVSSQDLFTSIERLKSAGLTSRKLTSEQRLSIAAMLDEDPLSEIGSLPTSSIIALAIFIVTRRFPPDDSETGVAFRFSRLVFVTVIAQALKEVKEFDENFFSTLVRLQAQISTALTQEDSTVMDEWQDYYFSNETWLKDFYAPMVLMATIPFHLDPGVKVDPLHWAEWYCKCLVEVLTYSLGDSSKQAWAKEALAPFSNSMNE
ncbi:hypothetical protein [Synechococcus sp. EJ6-Ellesmere]|uniref:hypothetical protein n=1 Tax=Synechococcus sp. EJ6-Ellesmere TaxID=2823734 RepID=UPI0020CE3504|nr:hypothetical protein [Synechococcus sp. EJ6-Ellesmere]